MHFTCYSTGGASGRAALDGARIHNEARSARRARSGHLARSLLTSSRDQNHDAQSPHGAGVFRRGV
jgi:hypothetical protein